MHRGRKILGALGWAQFNNPERDEEDRVREGMESLLLAIHLENDYVPTLVYLTRAYVHQQEFENAANVVRRACMLSPERSIQDLRTFVESKQQEHESDESSEQ